MVCISNKNRQTQRGSGSDGFIDERHSQLKSYPGERHA